MIHQLKKPDLNVNTVTAAANANKGSVGDFGHSTSLSELLGCVVRTLVNLPGGAGSPSVPAPGFRDAVIPINAINAILIDVYQ